MKRYSLAAASLPLVAGGLVAVTSPPAQADCSHGWSNEDPGSGSVIWSDGEPKLRTGPHAGCGLVYWVNGGSDVYYHCAVVNADGNTWTHVRLAGTDESGWIWDGYLDDGGSTKRC